MNENLFNFPGESAGTGEGNPFDLGDFAELTGDSAKNPFMDLLAEGGTADETQPKGSSDAQPAGQTPKEHPQSEQDNQTAEQNSSEDAPAPKPSETPQPKTPSAPKDAGGEDAASEEEENPLMAAINRQEERNARKANEPIFAQLPVFSYNLITLLLDTMYPFLGDTWCL